MNDSFNSADNRTASLLDEIANPRNERLLNSCLKSFSDWLPRSMSLSGADIQVNM